MKLLLTACLGMLYTAEIWSQDTLSVRSVVIQRDFKASFTPTVNYIPANHYAKHLGFFCKQEIKAEKKNIPIKYDWAVLTTATGWKISRDILYLHNR